jgi:RHS repeat-associated protein
MEMPGRKYNPQGYRYGYQGSENDSDIYASLYTTLYRQLDTRLGRWWSIDPETDNLPHQSPYCSMDNNPIKNNDPNGDWIPQVVGALVGAAVEYGSQVVANRFEGKSWSESLTDIDILDVAISAGEGFVTSGTSAVKGVLRKAAVTIGSEGIRNTFDAKIDGMKINDSKNVIKNTTLGLVAGRVTNSIPSPKVKIKAEITPKQAVKEARKTSVVNRADRIKIEKTASSKLKDAKSINKTLNEAPASLGVGSPTEIIKRKTDKP